jgi:hypothetical protein
LPRPAWTCCARPARANSRVGARFFKPLRQVIESINDTFKSQLDLERHGGHTPTGVWIRIAQRILALTAVIWYNDHTGQPINDYVHYACARITTHARVLTHATA